MNHKLIVPALASVLAVAIAISGCNDSKPSTTAASVPEVGVVTLRPETVSLSDVLPGRTSAYRITG